MLEENIKKYKTRLEDRGISLPEDKFLSLVNQEGQDRVVRSDDLSKILRALPEPPGIKCRFSSLDRIIDGFKFGELIVISGRTGEGKTTLLQSFTADFAKNIERDGERCLWFSYEMNHRELFDRFGEELPTFFVPLNLKGGDFQWMKDRILEGIMKWDVRVVFIDHLHYLLEMQSLMKGNSSLVIGQAMRDLKRIAVDTKTVIFLVAHTGKLDITSDPGINDIRDSSFVGQEADMVMFAYRSIEEGMFLSVNKNRRKGKRGKVRLAFKNGRFYEMETDPAKILGGVEEK